MKKNVLSGMERRRVEDWLLAHKGEIESGRFSRERAHSLVCDVVSNAVTIHNILNCAKTMGVKFRAARTGMRGGVSLRKTAAVAACIRRVAVFAESLATQLGVPVPADVKEIAASPLAWIEREYRTILAADVGGSSSNGVTQRVIPLTPYERSK